jgi:hypothetical protein
VKDGMLAGTGFEFTVQMDTGTVAGNVEGLLTAKYEDFLLAPGITKLDLLYGSIENESNISTNLGLTLKGTPRLKVDFPWWVHLIPPFTGDIDYRIDLGFVDVTTNTHTDFTTGLNDLAVGYGFHEVLPFNFDVVIVGAEANLNLKQDVYFRPETIAGMLRYTHESGLERTLNINIDKDGLHPFELNLDRPGHWEVSLEEVAVKDNTFRQDMGFVLHLGVGVPILSAEFEFDAAILDFGIFDSDFALDFTSHGYDGDSESVDRLGRFSIYVVPESGSVWLLSAALVGLLGLRRKLSRRGKPAKGS